MAGPDHTNGTTFVYLNTANLYVMKIKFFIFTLILFSTLTGLYSQELEYRDGYYFKDGMLYTGTHTEYFENGETKVIRNIKDGTEHGKVTLFHSNGNKNEERTYVMGLKEGVWISWSEEGIKIAEASYKNDLKHGYWYVWDHSGVKRYEMYYQEGKKSGTWYMWNEKGELVNKREY